METYLALAIIIIIAILSGVVALVLEPRQIADDVMKDHFGDVPHVE